MEAERTRRASLRKSGEGRELRTVSPEPASGPTTIQNMFGFLQDYVPQAVAGQREERKERVLWALFETGDINDVSLLRRSECTSDLPLLLILGLTSGYSVWLVQPLGSAKELFSAVGESEVVRVVRLTRTPECVEGVGGDRFSQQRPIMAVVKRGRRSTNTPYSTIQFLSLRGGGGGGEGGRGREDSQTVWRVDFKKAIVDVKCNRRVVVVVLKSRVVVLDAASYDNKFVIKNGYPSLGYPCNPTALGTRWLAFAESKLTSKHQSIGGMSDATPPSVATTVLKNVKKVTSVLTETLSGWTGIAQQEPPPTSSTRATQVTDEATASIVSIVDTHQTHDSSKEVQLSDLSRDGCVVAHFPAHAGPGEHIAALSFNHTGSLLLTASTGGHDFHVFHLLPHPWLSSETAVHHLYTLFRGATSGMVQDISFSSDSRWVAVSTLNGTSHIFPLNPYGGDITLRTHCSPHVVNQLSRFHTSAGIDTLPPPSHFTALSSTPGQTPSLSPREGVTGGGGGGARAREQACPSSGNVGGGSGPSWSNPRSLPLPVPLSVSALLQVKQPYLSGAGDAKSSAGHTPSLYTSLRGAGPDGVEPTASLAGPDTTCVRALFGFCPSGKTGNTGGGWGRGDSGEGALYSLYVVGSSGELTEHVLVPRKRAEAPEGEDAPVELQHQPRICWKLLSSPPPSSMPLPLPATNPLLSAYDKFCNLVKELQEGGGGGGSGTKTDGEWLSQVEILSHAPPTRRLWMGPQFSFKTYQPSSSSGQIAAIATPSPPNTVIYSSSGGGGGGVEGGVRGRTQTYAGLASERADQEGGEVGVVSQSVDSAILSLTRAHSGQLADLLLLDPPELQGMSLESLGTSPVPVPLPTVRSGHGHGEEGGMESGPASLEPGVVEVFGSWKKVAPHLEPGRHDGDVERQLEEAMDDHSPTVHVVSSGAVALKGFKPTHESH